MMRISEISHSDTVVRLRIEGRVTQATAAELSAAVGACLTPRCAVSLDLANVTFADASGVAALLALRAKGVVMVACSGFVSEMMRSAGGSAVPAALLAHGERALIARLQRGDEAAFATLVEQNAGRMLAAARRLLRNEDEAQDAVQEAFLSAFKALAGFNGESRLSTWLHRITVNAALMRLRSRKARPEQPIEELLPRFDAGGAWLDAGGGDAVLSAAERLEQRETRVAVRRCIDRLPEAYRTILLLRDIEDLDTGETAERLGITPNAVKIRLHRARQALRTLLQQELSAEQAA